jgi:hypothetical protein
MTKTVYSKTSDGSHGKRKRKAIILVGLGMLYSKG